MNTQPQFVRGDDNITALRTGQEAPKETHGGVPRFFIHRVAREDGSLHEIECVEIHIPGDTKSIPINKVTQREKQRWPREYEAFKKGEGYDVEGTSLELFLGRDDPRIPDLRYHKIMTVEQLADMSDTHVQNLGMGYMALRDTAREYIGKRSSSETLLAQIAEMKAEIAEMKGGKSDEVAEVKQPEITDPITEPTDGPTPYEVTRQFGGKFSITGPDGNVHEETGPGAKERCEEWIKVNG